jgi:CPA1 family monovalent cation:H+ antiporter
VEAALDYLEESRSKDEAEFDALYDDITGHYRERLNALSSPDVDNNNLKPEHHRRLYRISRELLRIERQTAVRLRDEGQISDETLRQLEHELDLREAGPPHAV